MLGGSVRSSLRSCVLRIGWYQWVSWLCSPFPSSLAATSMRSACRQQRCRGHKARSRTPECNLKRQMKRTVQVVNVCEQGRGRGALPYTLIGNENSLSANARRGTGIQMDFFSIALMNTSALHGVSTAEEQLLTDGIIVRSCLKPRTINLPVPFKQLKTISAFSNTDYAVIWPQEEILEDILDRKGLHSCTCLQGQLS
eukprot:1155398-Pelagomonas_calceolata.AAC.3